MVKLRVVSVKGNWHDAVEIALAGVPRKGDFIYLEGMPFEVDAVRWATDCIEVLLQAPNPELLDRTLRVLRAREEERMSLAADVLARAAELAADELDAPIEDLEVLREGR